MTTQEPTRENPFTAGDAPYDENPLHSERQAEGVEREEPSAADEQADVDEEMEFEEIALPGSLREGFAQVAEAIRGIVRAQPLAVLAAAAGAAYIAGRVASRR